MKNSKDKSVTIYNPHFIDFGETIRVNKIEFGEQTRIAFYYKPPSYYHQGGWIQIDQDTYITYDNGKTKLKLIATDGIPIAPEKHYFTEANCEHIFWLIFPKMSPKVKSIDIIERNEPGSYFNFFQLDLTRWSPNPPRIDGPVICELSAAERNALHKKVLELKIKRITIKETKQECIDNQTYEKAVEVRDQERQNESELMEMKNLLLEWYGSMERTPDNYKTLNDIHTILCEFLIDNDQFNENYILEVKAERSRIVNRLLRCHPERDIEKILELHKKVNAIDNFCTRLLSRS